MSDDPARRLGIGTGEHFRFQYRCEAGPHNFMSSERHTKCLWGCEDDSLLSLLVDPETAFALADELASR